MVTLTQQYSEGNPVGLVDEFGRPWRQDPNTGAWQIGQWTGAADPDSNAPVYNWVNQDPNAEQARAQFGLSPFASYLGQLMPSAYGTDAAGYYSNNPDQLNALFERAYSGSGANTNPYGSPQAAAALREIATKLGLPQWKADEAALRYAQMHFDQQGQGYSEATNPNIIADAVLKDLTKQAGVNYQGASPDQIQNWINDATSYQQLLQSRDNDSFGQGAGPIGELIGVNLNSIGNTIDWAKENPEDFAVQGLATGNIGMTPAGTRALNWFSDQQLGGSGDEYDSQITQFGDINTDANLKDAAGLGYDPSLTALIRSFLQTAAASEATAGLTSGYEAAGMSSANAGTAAGATTGAVGAYGSGGNTADIIKQLLITYLTSGMAGNEAKTAAQAYKAYQAYDRGDYAGAAAGATGAVGNLYGTDGAGTLSTTAPDKSAGGNMWYDDASSDWLNDYYGSGYNANYEPGMGGDDWGYDYYGTGSANVNENYRPGSGTSWWDDVTGTLGGIGTTASGLLSGPTGGLLSRFLGGSGNSAPTTATPAGGGGTSANGVSLGNLLGILSGAAAGMAGAKNLANKYDAMSQRYEGFGAPYRERLQQLYADPNSFLTSAEVQTPVQLGTNALMRSLSTTGNPYGSGHALQEGQNYASNLLFSRLGEEKNRLGGFGGLTAFAQAAPGAASKAADAAAGQYTSAAYGLDRALNPPKTLAQQLGLV